MDDSWIPLIVIGGVVLMVIVVMGGMVGRTAAIAAARKREAEADALHNERYRQLAEECAIGLQQTSDQLVKLNERVTAIEKLLRDVGE
jgi:Tfp pilus assembly protein PilO